MKHERAREKRAGQPALVSESGLSRVPRGTQWEPSRTAALLLPELQDVLWGNTGNADVWSEDACRRGGSSPVDRDATWQLARGGRDHRAQIRDDQRVAEAGGDPCGGPHAGAGQRSAPEPGGNR